MAEVFTEKGSRDLIIYGSLVCTVAGGVIGSSYAILTNFKPLRVPAIRMGFSWGLAGFTFLTLRQFILKGEHQKIAKYGLKPSQTKDSDELYSSCSSGIITGGIFGALSGTRFGALTGTAILGTTSYVLQKMYTKFNRYRQSIILDQMGIQQPKNNSEISGFSASSEKIFSKLQSEFYKKYFSWVPIKSLTHDEYMEILNIREEEILTRLHQIEKELESLNEHIN
ncbi:hypothetical protein BB560_005098 [Smittium megazygosporum]|uniref:Uncharacterized protein n=1 Tax=Smittium megazygosporum TaxID=133381 RepID=A0A2T9Z7L0_9FUNG|nr:hypothetical protein BB560_005098 [Smittium megazygosporum]